MEEVELHGRLCGDGPGTILIVEGAILWINMIGELWRMSSEQIRYAAYEERMGVEVHGDLPGAEAPAEDDVFCEGDERGHPRARHDEGEVKLPQIPKEDRAIEKRERAACGVIRGGSEIKFGIMIGPRGGNVCSFARTKCGGRGEQCEAGWSS